MRRLVFLSPDVAQAKHVVECLRADGIEEKHIYAVGRADAPMDELPDAGPEDNDFLPAYKRGVTMGGVGGVFAGLVAMAFPPAGIVIGGGGVLLLGLAGASIGGLGTGLMGIAQPSSRLNKYEEDIQAGRVLILVDVPGDRVTHVENLIRRCDPEVEIEDIDPAAPLIPPK
jgi:hypothetical protein